MQYQKSPFLKRRQPRSVLKRKPVNATSLKMSKQQSPFYNINSIIQQFNIKQIYVSYSLQHFKNRVKKKFNLKDYTNKQKPCIFFGVYDMNDINNIRNHQTISYVMPGGSDLPNCKHVVNENVRFISISRNIQARFQAVGENSTLVNFNLVDRNLFKPVSKTDSKIFIYDGFIKKPQNAKIYGKQYHDQVRKKLPQYQYIFSSDLNLPYEKMPDIYAQCFIGLRLTVNDGNANMVQEMEAMRIPVVHNFSNYGLKWKNVDDIIKHILNKAPKQKNSNANIKNNNQIVRTIKRKNRAKQEQQKRENRAKQEREKLAIKKTLSQSPLSSTIKHYISIINKYNTSSNSELHNITIIINSYNPDPIDLYKSISSCLNQEKIECKIIISTVENDPTIKLVNDLNNPNIELVICKLSEHPGRGSKGIFFQLNKALKEVKTRFVSYFSSNDIMLPTKCYNEIESLKNNNSIFCFSRYNSYYPLTKKTERFNYPKNLMNYSNLLKSNFINDCATIDLNQLTEPLQFNYEKYGNVCYWHLWLSLLQKNGEKCMSINDNIEWEYIRDISKSQAMERSKNKSKQELYWNQREFMLSEFDVNIKPKSIYSYDNTNEKFWWWNDPNNKKPVEMTVALPALNAKKIIWLALESLKNQININFAWELIVFEEEGISKKIVQSYVGRLPGCVRIIYKNINKNDGFYKKEDIIKNNCLSYYTLLEKWINMSKIADKNSKIFVKHAVDCYSPPKRLYIHYEHFKNDMCYYSTQPKGYFYNIKSDKWMLYNGYLREPVSWESIF